MFRLMIELIGGRLLFGGKYDTKEDAQAALNNGTAGLSDNSEVMRYFLREIVTKEIIPLDIPLTILVCYLGTKWGYFDNQFCDWIFETVNRIC